MLVVHTFIAYILKFKEFMFKYSSLNKIIYYNHTLKYKCCIAYFSTIFNDFSFVEGADIYTAHMRSKLIAIPMRKLGARYVLRASTDFSFASHTYYDYFQAKSKHSQVVMRGLNESEKSTAKMVKIHSCQFIKYSYPKTCNFKKLYICSIRGTSLFWYLYFYLL